VDEGHFCHYIMMTGFNNKDSQSAPYLNEVDTYALNKNFRNLIVEHSGTKVMLWKCLASLKLGYDILLANPFQLINHSSI
jgi:hypothetical protein